MVKRPDLFGYSPLWNISYIEGFKISFCFVYFVCFVIYSPTLKYRIPERT